MIKEVTLTLPPVKTGTDWATVLTFSDLDITDIEFKCDLYDTTVKPYVKVGSLIATKDIPLKKVKLVLPRAVTKTLSAKTYYADIVFISDSLARPYITLVVPMIPGLTQYE